jgi:hypothetical protein
MCVIRPSAAAPLLGLLALCVGVAVLLTNWGLVQGAQTRAGLYTFELRGGYFFGPGPIVPNTVLPEGRLTNIHFDLRSWRGYCEFHNDGRPNSKLSDAQTRINQNIDAGHLLIGGGTSPILLAAVDGGPHHGREEYALDEHYRLVWRVDIALDSGFPEGIIRLNDFVLTTGVARIARSQQSVRGEPGGYDQAGTLSSGTFIAGRLGDFDQDGFLDGVLVAAPNVPLAADMLPGAPVGNQRGFRTNLPLEPWLSLELVLRGVLQLQAPIETLLAEGDLGQTAQLVADMRDRTRAANANMERAEADTRWSNTQTRDAIKALQVTLGAYESAVEDLARRFQSESSKTDGNSLREAGRRAFEPLAVAIAQVAAINDRSSATLPRVRGDDSVSALQGEP